MKCIIIIIIMYRVNPNPNDFLPRFLPFPMAEKLEKAEIVLKNWL